MIRMKKLFLLTLVVFGTLSLQGQAIGIQAGLNFASGTFDDGVQSDDLESITGIRIGPVVQFNLGPVFELHTGAIYSQQGYEITEAANLGKITIDYIDIPLNLAASFDLGGIGAFIKAGPVIGLGVGGKTSTSLGDFDIEFGSGEDETKALDWGGAVGAGIKLGTLQIDATYDISLDDLSNNNAGYKNKVFHVALSFVIGG